MPISENDYKALIIKIINSDPNASLSLLTIPDKRVATAVFDFKVLVNNLIRLAEVDKNRYDAVNVDEIMSLEPDPSAFASREDYLKAKEQHDRIKKLLSAISRKKVYLSLTDLEQILNYTDAFVAYLHAVSAIKGKRLSTLMTHVEKYEVPKSSGLFSKMFSKDEEG